MTLDVHVETASGHVAVEWDEMNSVASLLAEVLVRVDRDLGDEYELYPEDGHRPLDARATLGECGYDGTANLRLEYRGIGGV